MNISRRQALQTASVILGGILSPSLLRAATEGALHSKAESSPARLFSIEQRRDVSILAETIIPTTNTPGAIAAGVPQFIEMMVADWYTEQERAIFLQGLTDIDNWCQQQYQLSLAKASAQQVTAALAQAEKLASEYQPPRNASFLSAQTDERTPFFTKIKELTVLGYFTSEVGIKQSLRYNPMPMEYQGDIPLETVGGQWAHF